MFKLIATLSLVLFQQPLLQPTVINKVPEKDDTEVMVILLDDVGVPLLEDANTPVLDALSEEGVVFTNAWALPYCSPARATLLTGRYPFRHGVGNNVKVNEPPAYELPYEEVILPEMFDFKSAAIGKWHLSHSKSHPTESGFNYFAGNMWNMGSGPNIGYYDWEKLVQTSLAPSKLYHTDDVMTEARYARRQPYSYLKRGISWNLNAKFRYVALNASHRPWNIKNNPPGYKGLEGYDCAKAQLEYFDLRLAELIEDFNGWVFIVGDNGSPVQLGGGKGTLTEAGIHVPLIVTGPGATPSTYDGQVSIVDIFATVCDIFDEPIPIGVANDSISFLQVLEGQHGARLYNFSEMFPINGVPQENRSVAIRSTTHKLMIHRDGQEEVETLYSMPYETVIPTPYTDNDEVEYKQLRTLLTYQYAW